VFHDEADCAAFVELLGRACGRTPMRVLGFCLMPNHFHLVVRPRRAGRRGSTGRSPRRSRPRFASAFSGVVRSAARGGSAAWPRRWACKAPSAPAAARARAEKSQKSTVTRIPSREYLDETQRLIARVNAWAESGKLDDELQDVDVNVATLESVAEFAERLAEPPAEEASEAPVPPDDG
jgi:hypothetical protein